MPGFPAGQPDEENRNVPGGDARDPRGLANGTGLDGAELLPRLDAEPFDLHIVGIRGEEAVFSLAESFHLMLFLFDIALIAQGNLDLFLDSGGERVEVRNEGSQIRIPDMRPPEQIWASGSRPASRLTSATTPT